MGADGANTASEVPSLRAVFGILMFLVCIFRFLARGCRRAPLATPIAADDIAWTFC